MAVVAGRLEAVARVLPSLILFFHDVAVHAGLGIVVEIRMPLGPVEGIAAEARQEAKAPGEDEEDHTRKKMLHHDLAVSTISRSRGRSAVRALS
jgi:hypothetical protein